MRWRPCHEVARRHRQLDTKMQDFNDELTDSQLIDLTAFLQTRYRIPRETEGLP